MSGSRRPAGADDNILARLERDGARGTSGGTIAGGRRALLALAGVLILGLIGTLGWLAHENATTRRVLPGALINAVVLEAPMAALAPPPAPVRPQAVAAARARIDPDPGEKIVEAIPAATVTTKGETPAPLVLLQAAHEAAPRPAAPRSAVRPALAAARKAAQPAAAPGKSEPQPVDSDVALLSAIIMHASSHAAERAERAELESQHRAGDTAKSH